MTVTVDGYTRFLLTVIAILLTVVAVGLWFETPNTVPTAMAKGTGAGEQLNPGKQLDELVKNTAKFNTSLAELQKLLVGGTVKVQVVEKAVKDQPIPAAPTKPRSNSDK